MKAVHLLVSSWIAALPLGGTVLRFPVQGSADPDRVAGLKAAIALETWDCPKHPAKDPGKIQLLRCATCGAALVKGDGRTGGEERFLRVEVDGSGLSILSGPGTGIGLLRLSTIAAALEGTGLSLARQGLRLRSHVLFEVAPTSGAKPEELRQALAPFGRLEMDASPGLVLLRLEDKKPGPEHDTVTAAVRDARYEVKDTLWIVNQCAGELLAAR